MGKHSGPKWMPGRGKRPCGSCCDSAAWHPASGSRRAGSRGRGRRPVGSQQGRLFPFPATHQEEGIPLLGGSRGARLEMAAFLGAGEGICPHPPGSGGAALDAPFSALPSPWAGGGQLMQFLPQAAQMAERPFPRDLRLKSGLDKGSVYPEGMNWELWDFRSSRRPKGRGGGLG